MTNKENLEEIFLRYLSQIKYEEDSLDQSIVLKQSKVLQNLSEITNSGTGIFDFSKKQMVYYSSNFGITLGYQVSDYEDEGQQFFARRIHPEDLQKLSISGITALKIFINLSGDEKLNHKVVNEYRMLNAKGEYVRMVEQYQILELDPKGQIWLMLTMVDVAPNQEHLEAGKSQLLNFRTGKFIPLEIPRKVQFELTRRETEVLKLVKKGLLSKEISDRLSISVHTVNTHRQRVIKKLGANNSMEAIIFASKYGLLE
ncbi:LuxR C-terminal-related transcriptional regulator [Phaeodactylibacter sp.]|uniref:LuxR C-terminal-related transcriptional regulator n=1 Tax=Phaeodactylibacter sp. TaxID=1940289 RepID=UPI0025ECC77C|nr:LuxR C-terminal-related transcriptional regulator [Phaeodactylibacter sp.]MCI4651402.1 LuxR C-terminal-related transcriptional regulator [Phaeodactylibacter sp.]MCI5093463.1 LuxR C-terminal-related transcriptional regulator [Phaeodactylibacter sp.]